MRWNWQHKYILTGKIEGERSRIKRDTCLSKKDKQQQFLQTRIPDYKRIHNKCGQHGRLESNDRRCLLLSFDWSGPWWRWMHWGTLNNNLSPISFAWHWESIFWERVSEWMTKGHLSFVQCERLQNENHKNGLQI